MPTRVAMTALEVIPVLATQDLMEMVLCVTVRSEVSSVIQYVFVEKLVERSLFDDTF